MYVVAKPPVWIICAMPRRMSGINAAKIPKVMYSRSSMLKSFFLCITKKRMIKPAIKSIVIFGIVVMYSQCGIKSIKMWLIIPKIKIKPGLRVLAPIAAPTIKCGVNII